MTTVGPAFVPTTSYGANKCEAIFAPPLSYRMGFKAGQISGGIFYSAKAIARDFKQIGPGRLLFRPIVKAPERKAGGFLTSDSEYFADDGRVIRALKRTYQFIPRRVLGLIRGDVQANARAKFVGEFDQDRQNLSLRAVIAAERFVRGEDGRINGLLRGDPNYNLTVMAGIQHTLLDTPIFKMSQVLNLKRRYASSLVLALATLGGGSMVIQERYVDPYLQARNEAIIADAVKKMKIRSLQYDVRNKDLKERWIQSVGTARTTAQRSQAEQNILIAVEARIVSNRSFFEDFAIEEFSATPESMAYLVRFPQFEHLEKYLEASQGSGFDEAAWNQIVYLNWTFHLMTDLAFDFVTDSSNLKEPLQDPVVKEAFDEVFSLPFMTKIRDLHRKKKLTADQAASLIGENLYYRTRFAEQHLLGGQQQTVSLEQLETDLLEVSLKNPARWDLPR